MTKVIHGVGARRTSAVEYDDEMAKKAFEALAKLRAKTQLPETGVPRLDLQSVASLAVGVGRALVQPSVRERFQDIAKALDLVLLDRIEPAGWALWYATVQRASAQAASSEAKVPVALVTRASELRERMLRVATYHFEHDTELGAELADIRAGSGYMDLATDLQRLASIYVRREETLARDQTWYEAADASAAGKTALQIVAALGDGRSKEAQRWAEETARAFLVLSSAYDEVRAAGLFLFRHGGGAERFPSLYSVRGLGGKRTETSEPTTGAGVEPSSGDNPT